MRTASTMFRNPCSLPLIIAQAAWKGTCVRGALFGAFVSGACVIFSDGHRSKSISGPGLVGSCE